MDGWQILAGRAYRSEYGIILRMDKGFGNALLDTESYYVSTMGRSFVQKVSSTPAVKFVGSATEDKHFAARDGATSRAASQE